MFPDRKHRPGNFRFPHDRAEDNRALHLCLSFPVALTAFRSELACVSSRPLDCLELASSAQKRELALAGDLEVSAILLCGPGHPFEAKVTQIPVWIVIGSVGPFRNVGPDVVLLRNGACPCLTKVCIRAYRLPYKNNLLKRVTRLVRNIHTGL